MYNHNNILKSGSVKYLSGAITGFKSLHGVETKNEVCVFCGCNHTTLSMEEVIAVGFGNALLTKNGECIYSEIDAQSCGDYVSVAEAEALAAKDPYQDWRIHLLAPFSGKHYQRQGECHWVLYENGKGFA